MKFKVGDRVRVRKDLKCNSFYGGVRVNDEMINNKGKILTIIGIDGRTYLMEGSSWFWTDEMFENKVEYTYEDLKKSPIGTKITFENKYVLMKTKEDGDQFTDNGCKNRSIEDLKDLRDNWFGGCYGKIIKIEEPEYKTVYESKVEILDEAEKRYLKGVIRPYKTVKYINKSTYDGGKKATVIITVIDIDGDNWEIQLPPFETRNMYKNMENEKEYTLEELGL